MEGVDHDVVILASLNDTIFPSYDVGFPGTGSWLGAVILDVARDRQHSVRERRPRVRAKIALAPSVVVGQELEEWQIDIVIIVEDVIHAHPIGDSGRNLGLEIRPNPCGLLIFRSDSVAIRAPSCSVTSA